MGDNRRLTRTAEFHFDGEVMRARFLPAAEVTGADAREHVEVMLQLTEGRPVLVLVDMRGARAQDREARALYAGERCVAFTRACALLVGSPLTRVLGSFFLGLNKPRYPTRLFTSETEAEQWLLSFRAPQSDGP